MKLPLFFGVREDTRNDLLLVSRVLSANLLVSHGDKANLALGVRRAQFSTIQSTGTNKQTKIRLRGREKYVIGIWSWVQESADKKRSLDEAMLLLPSHLTTSSL